MDRNVVIGPVEQFNAEISVPASPGIKLFEVFPFDVAAWVRLRNNGADAVRIAIGQSPVESAFPLEAGQVLELILAPETKIFAVRAQSAVADVPVRVWAVTVWSGIALAPTGRDFSREVLRDAP